MLKNPVKMDVSKLCRSCMKEVASWECENFDQRIVDMFTFCTNITITGDRLPKQFCYDCTIRVESCYTYIKQAQEVNNTLINIVTETRSVIVENENNIRNLQSNNELNCNQDHKMHSFIQNYDANSMFDDLNDNQNDDYSEVIPIHTTNYADFTDTVNIDSIQDVEVINKEFSRRPADRENGYSAIETKNTEETKIICLVCKKTFVSLPWYKKHMKKHHSEHQSTPEHTKDHSEVEDGIDKTINIGEKEIKICPLCRKSFTSKIWFTRHMEREHSETKVYMCVHCDKSFATSHQLQYHRAAHGAARRQRCAAPGCGAHFATRKQLAAHARAHSDRRPYQCTQCHKTFKIKSILTCHMKVHDNHKPFLCYICGWGFSTANNLESHMRRHTRERPFKCASCGYRAAFASNLRRHERAHAAGAAAERRHACATCHKRFRESGALARHVRIHTGERPYRCPSCPLAFADGWKRKVHMMRAHQLTLNDIPRLAKDGRPLPTMPRCDDVVLP